MDQARYYSSTLEPVRELISFGTLVDKLVWSRLAVRKALGSALKRFHHSFTLEGEPS